MVKVMFFARNCGKLKESFSGIFYLIMKLNFYFYFQRISLRNVYFKFFIFIY